MDGAGQHGSILSEIRQQIHVESNVITMASSFGRITSRRKRDAVSCSASIMRSMLALVSISRPA